MTKGLSVAAPIRIIHHKPLIIFKSCIKVAPAIKAMPPIITP